MSRALITVPATAKRGEIVEIKTLMSHPMETGFRAGSDGRVLPRDIIQRFVCSYNGVEIFRADLFPAMSANPFVVFSTLAIESGTLTFTWQGDNGFSHSETAQITVA
jgi:sulfur-oxidizing protein SoxZ